MNNKKLALMKLTKNRLDKQSLNRMNQKIYCSKFYELHLQIQNFSERTLLFLKECVELSVSIPR